VQYGYEMKKQEALIDPVVDEFLSMMRK